MDFLKILEKKRDNKVLSKDEIHYVVEKTVDGTLPDYQISAFLMATFINGMNDDEIYDLTMSMVDTGNIEYVPGISEHSVDKHSTGGVGDKLTLCIAPLLATYGVPIVKMSGRGLGITGGTLDKLESIPGFNIHLTENQIEQQAKDIGIVIAAQTNQLAPADKRFYELRDVTATIDSYPLIASSIMSKKLAIKNKALCIDLKVGKGAFMKDLKSAEELARIFKFIAEKNGRTIRILLTDMNSPIGRCVGNSLEVEEVVETLKGHLQEEVYEMSIKFAAESIKMLEPSKNIDDISEELKKLVKCGKVYDKFLDMIRAQSGDINWLDTIEHNLSNNKFIIKANKSGYIQYDAEKVGYLSLMCGGGRKTKEDIIDHGAGIKFLITNDNYVHEGDDIFVVYTNKKYDEIENYINQTFEIAKNQLHIKRIIKVI